VQPSVHVKLFFEGEEEAGSPHLGALLREHAELLASDLWIFCDGPIHQSGLQQVVFGVRGVIGANLTVYGPLRALHSGHYGNWAPNPAAMLASMLAAMRAPDGRIRISGFYDDVRPLSAADRQAIAAVPGVEAQLRSEFGIASSEVPNALLIERILQPAMNVRGLESGAVGPQSRNAIPTQARASIDFRLVPDQDPARVRQRVELHFARNRRSNSDARTRRSYASTGTRDTPPCAHPWTSRFRPPWCKPSRKPAMARSCASRRWGAASPCTCFATFSGHR